MPLSGSAAVVPQFAPPCAPGIETVSFNAGGVNSPSLRAFAIRFFHVSRCSGVRMYGLMSSARQPLRCERRRRCRKRLRRPRRSPGISLRRHAALFDWPHRLPGDAIEHVEVSGLAGLRDDIDRLAVPAIVVSCGAATLS